MLTRKFPVCFLAVLMIASGASAQNFDLEGFYMPLGNWSKDFKNIEHIALRGTKSTNINGWIHTSSSRFKLANAKLNGKNFSFTTTKSSGVSYEFTGSFVRLEKFLETQPPTSEAVLKGTLKKFRNGKKIAENSVSFFYFVGD